MRKLILFILTTVLFINAYSQDTPKPPLSDFVGRYVFPEGSVVPDVTVSQSGEALTISSAAGNSALTELGIDSFTIVEFSGLAAFKRGEDKKVNAIHIEAQGYVLDGQKQSNGALAFTYYIKPDAFVISRKLNQKL